MHKPITTIPRDADIDAIIREARERFIERALQALAFIRDLPTESHGYLKRIDAGELIEMARVALEQEFER